MMCKYGIIGELIAVACPVHCGLHPLIKEDCKSTKIHHLPARRQLCEEPSSSQLTYDQ